MQIIFSFFDKYFFLALAVFISVLFSKYLVKQIGNDRAEQIEEAVLIAMLWSEEVFGIGHGDEKWSKSWQKIVEILATKSIELSEKEISFTTTLMKATVPKINQIVYSALPETLKSKREVNFRSKDVKDLINKLKVKNKVGQL